jgi:GNAT superfamily N-acetyltransferase
MTQRHTKIWYDLTIALIYPSVLGAIVFFFLDATVRVYLLSLLEQGVSFFDFESVFKILPQFNFFHALGVSGTVGFIGFSLITIMVIVHHSTDYLYSKYSENEYTFKNFFWDSIISLLLAIAYIALSVEARGSIQQVKSAFFIFWAALAITYGIFFWWDARAYWELRDVDQARAKFYWGMVFWFEILAIPVFITLALLSFFITEPNWFSNAYAIASIVIFAIFTMWFCQKTYKLELLTRELSIAMSPVQKFPSQSTPSNFSAVDLRSAEPSDILACARIFADAYREVYSEPWTLETADARLRELYQIASDYCFVLHLNGEVAGFTFARPFVWHDGIRIWIEEVVVEKEHRGKGYGKLLMQTLIDKCRADSIVGVALISRQDSAAYKIYTKMGLHPSEWIHLEANLDELL